MYTETKKRSYHADMSSLISKLTVIMFIIVPLMETQKYTKNVLPNLPKYTSKVERSHSWYET